MVACITPVLYMVIRVRMCVGECMVACITPVLYMVIRVRMCVGECMVACITPVLYMVIRVRMCVGACTLACIIMYIISFNQMYSSAHWANVCSVQSLYTNRDNGQIKIRT